MIDSRSQFYLQMLNLKPATPSDIVSGGRPQPSPGIPNSAQAISTALGMISKHCRAGTLLLQAVYLGGYSVKTVEELTRWLTRQSQMFDIGPKLLTLEKAKAEPYQFGESFRVALADLLLSEICHLAGSHYCGYCKGRRNDCEHCRGLGVLPNRVYGERRRVERLGLHGEGITRHFWRNHLQSEYDAMLTTLLGELSHASVLLHGALRGDSMPQSTEHGLRNPRELNAYNRWPTKQWYSGVADSGG